MALHFPPAYTMTTKDILFSFDTTGSMYPCLTQVRRVVAETVEELFNNIPGLRVAVIAHGDYCDERLAISCIDFTTDRRQLCRFIKEVPPTSGGDADECYEAVLRHARGLSWEAGKEKAFVLIGDANPHDTYYRNHHALAQPKVADWRNEARLLCEAGIKLYPVQALGRYAPFYQNLADLSMTPKLDLPQFSDITDILMAVAYQNAGQLQQFEKEIKIGKRKVSMHVMRTLDKLAGRALSNRSVKIGSRFQVLDVDINCSIKQFVEKNGLEFEKGRGFYEFTKTEDIQEYKEVVAQNNDTGAIIHGKRARSVLGIPEGRVRAKPSSDTHTGFVQSTSVNRKLIGGTKFLYEIQDHEGVDA